MKKNIPLNVLEILEKFVNLQGEKFLVLEPDNFLVRVKDDDDKSNFYFNIEDYKNEGDLKLLIDWSPMNKEFIENKKMWIYSKQLDGYFKNWITLLEGYSTVKSFYDDGILKSFAESYYAEFKIIDENAEREPLKPNQILLLDAHLEYIEQNIEKYGDKDNQKEIQEIINDTIELRESLTKKTKATIIRNLSNIWAKITKGGTKLLKEFINEGKRQVVKESLRYFIQHGTDLI